MGTELIPQLAAAALVIVLAVVFVASIGRSSGRGPGHWLKLVRSKDSLRLSRLGIEHPAVEILTRACLSPQHTLHLIQVGEKRLLLATHPGGVTVLEQPGSGPGPAPPPGGPS